VAFEFEKAGDFADDKVVSGDAQSGAEFSIVFGGEIRGEIEAAENFCVLLAPANTRGEILFGHRIGNGDEMSGNAAGAAFGGAEEEIREAVLKIAEGRAVDRVDDGGHTRFGGGESAENAGFAAVCVDDVGARTAEELL